MHTHTVETADRASILVNIHVYAQDVYMYMLEAYTNTFENTHTHIHLQTR